MQQPRDVIAEHLGVSTGKLLTTLADELIAELRTAGWHLVSTPQWVRQRKPDDEFLDNRLEEVLLGVRVDETIVSGRQAFFPELLAGATDPEGYMQRIREHVEHLVAVELMKALGR